MKIQLLPSNISDPVHLQPLTCFLINGTLAVDGGSLGFALSLDAQRMVRQVIITHSHSDHIASLPMFIAESFPFLRESVSVYATREVIASLKEHVFNDKIWPDFHQIKLLHGNESGLRYEEIEPFIPFVIGELKITPVPTEHTVPTVGLAIEDKSASVVLTSDTYNTEAIWKLANKLDNLRAVFVDVSFPSEMAALAAASKHLTPQGLVIELGKLGRKAAIFAVHLKPQFSARIKEELLSLNIPDLSICEIGREYLFE